MIGKDSKVGMSTKVGGMGYGYGHGYGSLNRGTDGKGASPRKIAKGKLHGHIGGC